LQFEIGCQEKELDFLFYVRDNGIGIEPCYADKLLLPFQKLNPEMESMGIGMALVE
jgi:two-component system, LuxR family, sensor kinase FixL